LPADDDLVAVAHHAVVHDRVDGGAEAALVFYL